MFFSSAMSALKKRQDEPDDDEEEDVFQHSREVVAAKTYSMETAVRYVYGQGFGMDIQILTDEEKEAIERARYCRKQLLRLKARRAAQEAGEADTSQILQQEEVEEWLANIELRLRQQSRQLGIPASEFPIFIAPIIARKGKKTVGNIASAATAAAAAIRMKLKQVGSESSMDSGASGDEKAAAIAALTDLMEELEELSLTARESKNATPTPQGPKRTVRFMTPRSSPFQTPRSTPFHTPLQSPLAEHSLVHRALRLKNVADLAADESKAAVHADAHSPEEQQHHQQQQKHGSPMRQPQPKHGSPLRQPQPQPQSQSQSQSPANILKKTKVSALVVAAGTRPNSSPPRTSDTTPPDPTLLETGKAPTTAANGTQQKTKKTRASQLVAGSSGRPNSSPGRPSGAASDPEVDTQNHHQVKMKPAIKSNLHRPRTLEISPLATHSSGSS